MDASPLNDRVNMSPLLIMLEHITLKPFARALATYALAAWNSKSGALWVPARGPVS
jgi:hypothetical protein